VTPVYYVVITGDCVPCPENTSHDLRLPSIPLASCHHASASRPECSRSPRVHSGYGFQRFHQYVTISQLQIHMLDEVRREFWRGEPFHICRHKYVAYVASLMILGNSGNLLCRRVKGQCREQAKTDKIKPVAHGVPLEVLGSVAFDHYFCDMRPYEQELPECDASQRDESRNERWKVIQTN